MFNLFAKKVMNEEAAKSFWEWFAEKEEWIKENNLQTDLRECYLRRKNTNADPHKRSRTIYADAVHEICQRFGYYE